MNKFPFDDHVIVNGRWLRPLTVVELDRIRRKIENKEQFDGIVPILWNNRLYWNEGAA